MVQVSPLAGNRFLLPMKRGARPMPREDIRDDLTEVCRRSRDRLRLVRWPRQDFLRSLQPSGVRRRRYRNRSAGQSDICGAPGGACIIHQSAGTA
jgi:hypothetical protein